MPVVPPVFLALCLSAAALGASAQSLPADVDTTGTRPSEGGAPDEITVRLGVLDIAEIDDREQVFTVDLFIEVQWRDPRLAVGGNAGAELRTLPLDEIWNPRLLVINSRGLDLLLPETATDQPRRSIA